MTSELSTAQRNAQRYGLTVGRLPRGLSHVRNAISAFRLKLERLVRAACGEVHLKHAGVIQTICRIEGHIAACQHKLREKADSLSAIEFLAFSREIARASVERDKCIRLLPLEVADTQPLFKSIIEIQAEQSAASDDPNASDAAVDDGATDEQ